MAGCGKVFLTVTCQEKKMKLIGKIRNDLRSLLNDEQGATMIEYILIVAAIALPLLAVIIWFKDDISTWFGEQYQEVKSGNAGDDPLD